MESRDWNSLTPYELRSLIAHLSELLEKALFNAASDTSSDTPSNTPPTTSETATAPTAAPMDTTPTPTRSETRPPSPTDSRPEPKKSRLDRPKTKPENSTDRRIPPSILPNYANATSKPKTNLYPALPPTTANTAASTSGPTSTPSTSGAPANNPPSLLDIQTKRPNNFTTSTAAPDKPQSVPPIILRDKSAWTRISQHLSTNRINYTRATNSRDGISIHTASESDYRILYKTLDTLKAPFHTYQLRSEKSLRVVMRGIIQDVPIEDIQADLLAQNYPTIRITRLHGKDSRPAPLVSIEIDKQYKSIFNLQRCCGLSVTFEPKNVFAGQRQCHKCQIFGHSQPNCHADYKCMKCAGSHSTHECEKPRTIPARCANCNGEHPSNFSGCPRNPNKSRLSQKPTPTPAGSYSDVTRNRQPTASHPTTFAQVLQNLMSTMMSTNPTDEQMRRFFVNSQQLFFLHESK